MTRPAAALAVLTFSILTVPGAAAAAATTTTGASTTTTTAPRPTTTAVIASKTAFSDSWPLDWAKVLVGPIVSVMIAIGVAKKTDRGAEKRAAAERSRHRAERDIDWIREAAMRCAEAARDWIAAVDVVTNSTAAAVREANELRAGADELEATRPGLETVAADALAAKERYLAERRANNQTLEHAANGAANAVTALTNQINDARSRADGLADDVKEVVAAATLAPQNEWLQAQLLAELLTPGSHALTRAIHRALSELTDALLVPRDHLDIAREHAEAAIQEHLKEAGVEINRLRGDAGAT